MMKEAAQGPISLYDRQDVETFSDAEMRKILGVASSAYELLKTRPGVILAELDELEITLVDDPTIARIHGEFFDDPTATDVITFEHGEILISVETARRQARKFKTEFHQELALYAIHGLAHLAGYDDRNPEDRVEMHAAQDALIEQLWEDS